MFSGSNSARGRKRSGSSIALALALATGTAVAAAGFAAPAYAQKKPKPPKVEYSKAFVAAYEPVAKAFEAVPEGGDYAPIKAQVAGVVSAAANEDDRNAAGSLLLQVGNKAKDPALQRQGLELMLASGKTPAADVGKYQFFVGNLAYQAKDYAAARTALQAALASGYPDQQSHALIMESYFGSNAPAEGLAYLTKVAGEMKAAGQPVPESWLVRGLQVAYNSKSAAASNELAALLVATQSNPKNWQAALQVVREVNAWTPEEALDLGRLMLISGGIQRDYDLAEYLEAADPRKLPNEVLAALDKAAADGVIQTNAPRFAEFRQVAQERAAGDRADAAKSAGQPQASGPSALATADLLLSVGNYAAAEAMYQQAIDKGGIDTNRALTRKGIAQVRQGKAAEAKATLAQVQGSRAPLAKLWAIYAEAPSTAAGG